MSSRALVEEIKEEKETNFVDTFQEVVLLLIGGVIGGWAFQVAASDVSIWIELRIYLVLLGVGLVTVYIIRLSPAIGNAVSNQIEE